MAWGTQEETHVHGQPPTLTHSAGAGSGSVPSASNGWDLAELQMHPKLRPPNRQTAKANGRTKERQPGLRLDPVAQRAMDELMSSHVQGGAGGSPAL